MAVSINWGFLIVGVLISRAVLFFGSILGPLIFGNFLLEFMGSGQLGRL